MATFSANPEQIAILKQGTDVWNAWRASFRVQHGVDVLAELNGAELIGANLNGANLSGADLSDAILHGAELSGADLSWANLSHANLDHAVLRNAELTGADLSWAEASWVELSRANLCGAKLCNATLHQAILRGANLTHAELDDAYLFGADLSKANLAGANLPGVILCMANLTRAVLSEANLYEANLSNADLTRADLTGAQLSGVNLVDVVLEKAKLKGCRVFGISAWRVKLDGAVQEDLIITGRGEPTVTVDSLEVAQFIYLLLNNQKIRQVIDTITSKVVLILGRFTPERKSVLDRLREELRRHDFLPILFDFDQPMARNTTETVSVLAHLARFVVADISDPRSIPQELQAIVPQLPSVPIQPLLYTGDQEWGMFDAFRDYPWVLDPYTYASLEQLCEMLPERVIAPAIRMCAEIAERRRARGN